MASANTSYGCIRASACSASARPTARAHKSPPTTGYRAAAAAGATPGWATPGPATPNLATPGWAAGPPPATATLAGCALVTGMPQQELPFVELFWTELGHSALG